jgi:hypothetical protein
MQLTWRDIESKAYEDGKGFRHMSVETTDRSLSAYSSVAVLLFSVQSELKFHDGLKEIKFSRGYED